MDGAGAVRCCGVFHVDGVPRWDGGGVRMCDGAGVYCMDACKWCYVCILVLHWMHVDDKDVNRRCGVFCMHLRDIGYACIIIHHL